MHKRCIIILVADPNSNGPFHDFWTLADYQVLQCMIQEEPKMMKLQIILLVVLFFYSRGKEPVYRAL